MPETGTGIRIALLDSGVRVPALRLKAGQRVTGRSFVNGTSSWNDWDGHGTRCASRLVDAQVGLVPAAELTALRIRRGACATRGSLTLALRWLLEGSSQSAWDLVLFGVGFTARTRDEAPFRELQTLIRELNQRGTLLVAPSGNRDRARSRFIDHPARYADVLSIGASLAPPQGDRAWAGNRDVGCAQQELDFLVHGCEVPTRQLSGSLASGFGTSFAAANAAAFLARYLQWRAARHGRLGHCAAQTLRAELDRSETVHQIALLEPAIERAISGEGICARSA